MMRLQLIALRVPVHEGHLALNLSRLVREDHLAEHLCLFVWIVLLLVVLDDDFIAFEDDFALMNHVTC